MEVAGKMAGKMTGKMVGKMRGAPWRSAISVVWFARQKK